MGKEVLLTQKYIIISTTGQVGAHGWKSGEGKAGNNSGGSKVRLTFQISPEKQLFKLKHQK